MTTIIQQHISSKLCNDMAEIGLTKEQINLIRDLSSCMYIELEIFVKMALEEYVHILLENYEQIGRSAREVIVKKYATNFSDRRIRDLNHHA